MKKIWKKFSKKQITLPRGAEERFSQSAFFFLRDHQWKSILLCSLYLTVLSVGLRQGGSHLRTVVNFGLTSYFMVPIIEELQVLVDVATAQVNQTIKSAMQEMEEIRRKLIQTFAEFFKNPVDLTLLNQEVEQLTKKALTQLQDLRAFSLNFCRKTKRGALNETEKFGFGLPDLPGVPNVPNLPGINTPIDLPAFTVPNVEPTKVDIFNLPPSLQSLLPPCPSNFLNVDPELVQLGELQMPGLSFRVEFKQTIRQVRTAQDVKREVSEEINKILAVIKEIFRILSILSPLLVSLFIFFFTTFQIKKAIKKKEHRYKRKNYTVGAYLSSSSQTLFTIFVLLLLLIIYYVVSHVNDILIERVYFVFRGNYTSTIQLSTTPDSKLSSLFKKIKDVTKDAATQGEWTINTKAPPLERNSQFSINSAIVVFVLCFLLLVISFLSKATANLKDQFLCDLSEQAKKFTPDGDFSVFVPPNSKLKDNGPLLE
eukprot:TRINITY_DN6088_c0_g1_i1.p1 TRINITY_DN6088_c0_g1~~TRINITY_DN6088_c0_g1_i1.p1  ORF type:complete len:484 (-),score=93.67 TRINITY_DN6088_c0_g1_i1:42-1493(-)